MFSPLRGYIDDADDDDEHILHKVNFECDAMIVIQLSTNVRKSHRYCPCGVVSLPMEFPLGFTVHSSAQCS